MTQRLMLRHSKVYEFVQDNDLDADVVVAVKYWDATGDPIVGTYLVIPNETERVMFILWYSTE